MTSDRPVICWFRRDLRVNDNPALYNAARTGLPVIPLFIVDTELIRRIPSDGAVFNFQAECLDDLSKNLRRLGGTLIIKSGKPRDVFEELRQESNASAVYFNRDYEPTALERDRRISNFLQSRGVDVHPFDDVVIHPPDQITTAEGRPYAVFTPYAAKWQKLEKPGPVGPPSRLKTPNLGSDPVPHAESLKRKTTISIPIVAGGESEAHKRWNSFLSHSVNFYGEKRDIPSHAGTSLMSPYLRFGCISPLRMYSDLTGSWLNTDLKGRDSITKYVSELIWREFYVSVLYHFPFTAESNYRRIFDKLRWSRDEKNFKAWKEGRTGFPLVDAGMRQLNATGWMHNRVRMVVASFLTKDLFIDWKKGEEYFSTKLFDIERASNVGGWQWSASTGVDPRPLRIFNPTLQSQRFDPDGAYIKQWIPELRTVPSKFIHEPYKMSQTLQKELGIIIGRGYPNPIVDHSRAASTFKQSYLRLKSLNR